MRPRLLLVPEFTELAWEIRPQLEEWAEVTTYDPPGVGNEPLPPEASQRFDRDHAGRRGLDELDRRGWSRAVVVADGWAIPTALRIVQQRPEVIAGMAVGHACLSFRKQGERPPISAGVWETMTQLLRNDHHAFIRHGITQATGGSVNEELAEAMLKRFPEGLLVEGWEAITADEPFEDSLVQLDCPLLLAKHEGCLMSTDEGFEDAVAALPEAHTVAVPDAPQSSPQFAEALRAFCDEVWTDSGDAHHPPSRSS